MVLEMYKTQAHSKTKTSTRSALSAKEASIAPTISLVLYYIYNNKASSVQDQHHYILKKASIELSDSDVACESMLFGIEQLPSRPVGQPNRPGPRARRSETGF